MVARASAAAGRYGCLRQVLRTDIHPDNRNGGHQLRQVSSQNQRVGAPLRVAFAVRGRLERAGLPPSQEVTPTLGEASSVHSGECQRPTASSGGSKGRRTLLKLSGGSWVSLEGLSTRDDARRGRRIAEFPLVRYRGALWLRTRLPQTRRLLTAGGSSGAGRRRPWVRRPASFQVVNEP